MPEKRRNAMKERNDWYEDEVYPLATIEEEEELSNLEDIHYDAWREEK